MGWKVIFAPRAHAIVRLFVSLLAMIKAAIRFGDYLVDRAEFLANFPELGTPIVKGPTFVGSCVNHT